MENQKGYITGEALYEKIQGLLNDSSQITRSIISLKSPRSARHEVAISILQEKLEEIETQLKEFKSGKYLNITECDKESAGEIIEKIQKGEGVVRTLIVGYDRERKEKGLHPYYIMMKHSNTQDINNHHLDRVVGWSETEGKAFELAREISKKEGGIRLAKLVREEPLRYIILRYDETYEKEGLDPFFVELRYEDEDDKDEIIAWAKTESEVIEAGKKVASKMGLGLKYDIYS